MEKTLFSNLVEKYLGGYVGALTDKISSSAFAAPLLHTKMLREEYSVDLNWGASVLNNSIVAADVVSLDASLPLKLRPAIMQATGVLPKLGIKFRKGEKFITDVNTLLARGGSQTEAVAKVLDDVPRIINAMLARKEIMFQQALSSGFCLVENNFDADSGNQGTAVRPSFGYLDDNKTNAAKGWSDAAATPLTDLRAMFDKAEAKGVTIKYVYLPRKYFNLLRSSAEGKELFAASAGLAASKNLPTATPSAMLSVLADEFGATFELVGGSFQLEKRDGTTKTVTPWEDGAVVGTPTNVVGRLVYSTLAEETAPVAGVSYTKSGSHLLISKYSKNDPLEEFTAGQALVMPVIDGAHSIFVLNAKGE